MPGKRKLDFADYDQPQPSDSDDANFDPTEHNRRSPPARRNKSRTKSKAPSRNKRARYGGSDIDEDDDVMMDSDQDDSFDDNRHDDEDSDKGAVNPVTGRRMRTAATKSTNYKESSAEEEDFEPRESVEERPKRSRVVRLKVTGKGKPAEETKTPGGRPPSRRTRANTEDAELLELSASGKHAVARSNRGSRSNSPDPLQTTRPTRGSKGLKQPPSTIEEATQESDSRILKAEDEGAEQDAVSAAEDEASAAGQGEDAGAAEEAAEGQAEADPEADAGVVGDDEDDEPVAAPRGRLTRQSRLRGQPKKSMQEASSDFEPGDDESGDGDMSASDAKSKKPRATSRDDDEYSSQQSRGRRAVQDNTRGKKRTRGESDDEDELDQDDLAQEIEELRESSHSRPRKKQQRASPQITYERKQRRAVKPVSYVPAPLQQLFDENDEVIPAGAPSRRKKSNRERAFVSTYGPFGGRSTEPPLLNGLWGAGDADGIDSDSSDDEPPEPSAAAAVRSHAVSLKSAERPDGGHKEAKQHDLGKIKSQKQLADSDPLGVDPTVDFKHVGGLGGHVDKLNEMLLLPLLYPELYKDNNVVPPRGVLFHGPPGTGKTLLARALANSVGVEGRKVSFYMRKGADALSKWVGEAEKQLRLLFEDARKNQPSIIFFDEIDGLAPVRSSKQEQIHASIVSTLLALMDGMDGRGQVIVIGATNRPDSVDPALRRPGRFDREFYFPLPDIDARKSILDIHTTKMNLPDDFKHHLAKSTKGYGGADLRAICTEALLNCAKRTYPQIYFSRDKLLIPELKLDVQAVDFAITMRKMVPSSSRSTASNLVELPKLIEPLLRKQLQTVLNRIEDIFPRKKNITALEEAMFEPYNDPDHGFAREELSEAFDRSRIFRPRMLITGLPGMGQQYLSRAVLHRFEGVHVETFDLPTLLSEGLNVEQVIAQRFNEAKRHKPVVLYCPSIDTWKTMLPVSAWAMFKALLTSIPATDAVLLLATTDCEREKVAPEIIKDFFPFSLKNLVEIHHPDRAARMEFFSNIISYVRKSPADFPEAAQRKKRVLEAFPLAPLPPPVEVVKTKTELWTEKKMDRLSLNHFKIFLQPIVDQLKKKYRKFYNPVILDSQIRYLYDEADPSFIRPDVTEQGSRPFELDKDKFDRDCLRETSTGKLYYNLDLGIIEERLSNGYYARPKDFTRDIATLLKDAKNIGDKDRVMKAKEMLANVEVDTADAESKFYMVNFEEVYQRQKERYKKSLEKEARLRATRNTVDLIQSDVQQDAEPAPGTTTAHFRLMSPAHLSNGAEGSSNHLSNGEITGANNVDMQMSGVDEDVTQPLSQMGPPSQWPRLDLARPGDVSARATAGNTQISQISAVTTIPPGMSPSAIINDASTTKTSDPSTNRASGHWSTQATNGVHSDAGEGSQIPDTQPQGDSGLSQGPGLSQAPSQSTSNESQWAHSQAHGLAKGQLQPRMGFGVDGADFSSPSSSDSPRARASKSIVGSLANVLNEEEASPRVSSGSSATSSQPPLIIAEANVDRFLQDLGARTSGCTVEQLEQINRELMAEIWNTRHEYNRTKVLAQIVDTFNESIRDMEEIQSFAPASQFDGPEGQDD